MLFQFPFPSSHPSRSHLCRPPDPQDCTAKTRSTQKAWLHSTQQETSMMLSVRGALLLPKPLPVVLPKALPAVKAWVSVSRRLWVRPLSRCTRSPALWPEREGRPSLYGRSRSVLRSLGTVASMESPPAGYRANVGICLVNQKNEVFVALRVDVPDSWQMPQGGIDEGEEPREAAIRELREETGVTSADIIGEVPEWLTYDFPTEVRAKLEELWGQDWTGQAQKWFLFRFRGDDSEITVAGDETEPAEFSDWKWLPVDQVLERAVGFKRPVYEQAFRILAPIMQDTLRTG